MDSKIGPRGVRVGAAYLLTGLAVAAVAVASYNQLLPAGQVAKCLPRTPEALGAARLFAATSLLGPLAWMLISLLGREANRAAYVAGRLVLLLLALCLMPLILFIGVAFTEGQLASKAACGMTDGGSVVVTAAMVLVPLGLMFLADTAVVRGKFTRARFAGVTAAGVIAIVAVCMVDGILG